MIDWPEDFREYAINPRDVFGNRLESLNELRMRNEVYIELVLSNNNLWQVEIVGFVLSRVTDAEEAYRTIISSVRAEKLDIQQALNMILDDSEGIDIALKEAEQWWPNRIDRVVPQLLPSPMMYDRGSFREEALHPTQLTVIQNSIEKALETVRGKKGSYDFSVRLGCLALGAQKGLDAQIGKTFGKQEFLKAVNSRVNLVVKKWLVEQKLILLVSNQF